MVYTRIKPPVSYKKFVESIPPNENMNSVLCNLLDTKIHVGGFCVFREDKDTITIYILCSNRALGKKMLDHLSDRGKTVIIDQPLQEAIPFYERYGWRLEQDGRSMIRSSPLV
jgi:hypothetical protein